MHDYEFGTEVYDQIIRRQRRRERYERWLSWIMIMGFIFMPGGRRG